MALRADDVDIDRDRVLVRRFQAGDDEAFDELYRRYHDRLERFCLRRVRDRHAAEEVAQETFTRALSSLPAFNGEQRFYPWMTVIAGRLCVDYFRHQARSEPCPDPNPGGVSGGQEEYLVDAVDSALAVEALARLGPRYQDVLNLREVEGWSYRRIADHYGVKVGTVETLLFRARQALRREFRLVDGAGLAAIPVLGALVRVAVRLRNRLPGWVPTTPTAGTLAAAAAASATAIAIAVVPARAPVRPAVRALTERRTAHHDPAGAAYSVPAELATGATSSSAAVVVSSTAPTAASAATAANADSDTDVADVPATVAAAPTGSSDSTTTTTVPAQGASGLGTVVGSTVTNTVTALATTLTPVLTVAPSLPTISLPPVSLPGLVVSPPTVNVGAVTGGMVNSVTGAGQQVLNSVLPGH